MGLAAPRRVLGLLAWSWAALAGSLGAAPGPDPPSWDDHGILRLARPALRIYTDRDGLPENSVFDVEVDRRGYVWVATENGAASYNGREWSPLALPEQRGVGFVRDILAASDGSLWLAMDRRGVFRLREGRWTVFQEATGFPSDTVLRLLETGEAGEEPSVWAATSAGLVRIRGESWTRFGEEAGLHDERVNALSPVEGAAGRPVFWVGTQTGVARFEDGRFTRGPLAAPGAPGSQVRDVAEVTGADGERELWVALDTEGLAVLSHGAWTTSDLPYSRLTVLLGSGAPPSRTVWVGTYGRGLARFEDGRWSRLDTGWGLPSDAVRCLRETVSPEGIRTLWIGTQGGGLVRLSDQGWRTIDSRLGLPDDAVGPLAETTDRGGGRSLWFGTTRGLARLLPDGTWRVHGRRDGFPAEDVTALRAVEEPGRPSTLWVGMSGAVARLRDERWTFWSRESGIPSQAIVTGIAASPGEDGEDAVWVATYGTGLACFQRGRWTILDPRSGFRNQLATLLATREADGRRALWLGASRAGLGRMEAGAWHQPGTRPPPPNDSVQCLLVAKGPDGHRQLWFGTRGGGGPYLLDLDRPGSAWVDVAALVRTPLPSTVVQMEQDSRGRIYVFTTKGVARLTPQRPTPEDPSAFSVVLYKTSDGLPSDRCNYRGSLVDHAGRVWAGTLGGAAFLDPATETEDRTPKPLYVERAEAGPARRAIAPGTVLGHRENGVRFSLALLSTHRVTETRFRTVLAGFDEQPTPWVADARREVTNLPAGRYVFRAWGRDWAGNVSGPVEVAFRVQPAPWRTWWAFLAYALLGVLAVASYVRLRTAGLRRERAVLEARVAERTAELKASEARAHEASRAKGAFLANMSHELRTPLNAILGFAQLMARERDRSPGDRERLSVINRSGEHLLRMIDDVLSFARIESGRLVLDPRPFDLHRTLSDLQGMLGVRAAARGLELRVEPSPDLPRHVVGDEGKLRQALVNLAGNAVKFTERGFVALRALSREGRVLFEVEDTGPGIAPEDRQRIFEAFTQTPVGRRHAEGAGLGLAITGSLVQLMGGTISLESEPGRGSLFRFDLALPEAEGPPPAGPDQPVVGLAPGQPQWRVLVADDREENRRPLVDLLATLGFSVREARDGAQAVEAWAAWAPQAVLMDVRMPVLDGCEAAREIRRLEARDGRPRTLVVAVTASVFEHDREAVIAAGCDEFVRKPFHEEVLLEILERRLGVAYRRREPETAASAPPSAAPAASELAAAPAAWRAALADALNRGDLAEAGRVADQAPADRAAQAQAVKTMIRGFRIDELLELLEEASR